MNNGALSVKKNQRKAVTHLGVRGKLSKALHLPSEIILPANSKVIIQLLESTDDGVLSFKLTVYKDITDGAVLPEEYYNIVPERISHIVHVDPLQYFIFDEHTEPSHEPLFPNPSSPSIDEVSQQSIPNCSFLASVQAILNHPDGWAFIRGMMKRNTDGTVTVRLFQNGVPQYVTIEASVLHNARGPLSRHKALWMHILEAAVAVLGTKDDLLYAENQQVVGQSVTEVFNGGVSYPFAMAILTGLRGYFNVCEIPDRCSWMVQILLRLCGTVTKKQDLFEHIKEQLANGQLVTSQTKLLKKANRPIPGFPYRHAFTVMGVYSKKNKQFDTEGREVDAGATDYITLRNPWGHTGLSYDSAEGRPFLNKAKGTFDIKLNDFCEHFSHVFATSSANELFSYERKRYHLISQIQNKFMVIKTETSLADLIVFRHNYEAYKDLLLELECLPWRGPDLSDGNGGRAPLQLNIMKQERPLDLRAQKALETSILQNADYDFCDIMDNEKMKFDILVQAYAHRCAALMTDFSQHVEWLKAQLSSRQALDRDFVAFTELKQKEVAISSLAASLSALNIPVDLQKLDTHPTQLNRIENLFDPVAYQHFVARYQDRITTILVDATGISREVTVATEEAIRAHQPEQRELQQLEQSIEYLDNWYFDLLFYASVSFTLIGSVLILLSFFTPAALPLVAIGAGLGGTGFVSCSVLSLIGFFSSPKSRFVGEDPAIQMQSELAI
jgi:hypothetical protein